MEISNNPSFSTVSSPSRKEGGGQTPSTSTDVNIEEQRTSTKQQKVPAQNGGTDYAAKASTEEQVHQGTTKEEMVQLAKSMNKSLNPLSTSLKFEFGEDIGGLYINVVDSKTDSVIRRFPSEEAVKLSVKMKEIVGIMFDQKI